MHNDRSTPTPVRERVGREKMSAFYFDDSVSVCFTELYCYCFVANVRSENFKLNARNFIGTD